VLADVAPTLLDVMGLPVPEEMGGQSLLSKWCNERKTQM
jgi:bisphosphoglycerate-independent phosphoglycerate mutase (AlkP superfamily)